MTQETIHATSVVFCGQGILLRGASGAGKSDLALRLVDAGGSLISDDRTEVKIEKGALIASPPAAIAGLIEIRGIGLRRMPYIKSARIGYCFDLVKHEDVPRMPEEALLTLHGVAIPLYKLYPFEVAAIAKIRALLQTSAAHD